ncbi:mitochondrial metalloendopeptidase OMA1-like [Silene latifolia]|uniref:mitochondrial metalloendopeptidase OMA1-like n=1 Tax=Silene latifolia TaxID=37657 RepID=UPI003D776CD9
MVFRYIQLKLRQLSLNFIRSYYQSSLVNNLNTHNNNRFLKNSLVRRRLINPVPGRLYAAVAATTNRMFAPMSLKSTAIITSWKPYKLASSIVTEVGKVPMLLMCIFLRVERLPFSNRLHFTFRSLPKRFSIFRTRFFADFIVQATMEEGSEVLPSTHEKTLRVASIARKLGQGMRDTLGLKKEFNIVAYEPGNESNPVWTVGQRSGQGLRRRSLCDIGSKKWFMRRYSTKHLEEAEWKVTVIKNRKFNAYLAPGKHIFVLTKLMDSCSDEELASVIGHEMGHAIGQHKTDFIMVELLSCFLEIALKKIFSSDQQLSSSPKKKNELEGIKKIVKNYLSQRLELEADYIGMMLMASAGYDPRVAPLNLSKADFAHGGNVNNITVSS